MTAYEERPLYPEQILRELKRLQGLLGYLRSEVEKAITLIRVGREPEALSILENVSERIEKELLELV